VTSFEGLHRAVGVAEEEGAVGVGDDVDRLGDANRSAEAIRDPLTVDETAVTEVELRAARAVRAEACVRADLQDTGAEEALLSDELRPDEKPRIGARRTRGVGDRDTHLRGEGEAEATLDPKDAELAVHGDEPERLRVERVRRPLPGVHRGLRRVLIVELGLARGEVHGRREPEDQHVRDAVVERERALELVVDELRARLAHVSHAEEVSPVVDDETEAEVVRAEDVGAVRVEKPLRVHGRSEEVGVEPLPVRLGDRLRRSRTRQRERARPRETGHPHEAQETATIRTHDPMRHSTKATIRAHFRGRIA
jgi:hypothetical protein